MAKSRKNLDRLIESTIFESYLKEDLGSRAVAPGTSYADPALGHVNNSQMVMKKQADSSLGSDLPLAPSALASVQLTDTLPPVDDADYVPKTAPEFGLAMHAIVADLPDDALEKLYRSFRRAVEKTLAGTINEARDDDYYMGLTDEQLFSGMDEEEIEELQKLADRLRAAGEDVPASWDTILTSEDPIVKIRKSQEVELEDVVEPVEVGREGITLADLANIMGVGIPGARQSVEKLTRRTAAFEKLVGEKEIKALQIYATMQFIKGIQPLVDEADVEELKLNRDVVRTLDSFRFFFVNSFLLKIYNKLYRAASKEIEGRLVRSGFPKRSALTIKNIMFGETATTPEKLRAKLEKDLVAADSPVDVDTLLSRLKDFYPTLKSIASLRGNDVAKMARERWSNLSQEAKQKEIVKALDQTEEFQTEFMPRLQAYEDDQS